LARVKAAGMRAALVVALLATITGPADAARRKTPPPPPAPVASVRTGVDLWRAGDYNGAVAMWTPFANAGDADAMFNIGQAYKLGRAVPKDMALARDWYRRAAIKGHLPAEANLGILLFQAGEKPEATRWLKAAADQNEMRAQYVLGIAHWNGDGVPKSLAMAYGYLARASAQGLLEATTALNDLTGVIPPQDRANGWAMATSLAAGNGVPVAIAAAAERGPSADSFRRDQVQKPLPQQQAQVVAPTLGWSVLRPGQPVKPALRQVPAPVPVPAATPTPVPATPSMAATANVPSPAAPPAAAVAPSTVPVVAATAPATAPTPASAGTVIPPVRPVDRPVAPPVMTAAVPTATTPAPGAATVTATGPAPPKSPVLPTTTASVTPRPAATLRAAEPAPAKPAAPPKPVEIAATAPKPVETVPPRLAPVPVATPKPAEAAPPKPTPAAEPVQVAATAVVAAKPAKPAAKAAPPAAKPATKAATPAAWRVQLGAFSKRTQAEAVWTDVKAKQKTLVANKTPFYEPADGVTKLQLGPFANQQAARDACAKIAFSGRACFVTQS